MSIIRKALVLVACVAVIAGVAALPGAAFGSVQDHQASRLRNACYW
ncbi:hypothetical protein ACFXPA_25770 [Amycolatopsis sp. NPDC059090]